MALLSMAAVVGILLVAAITLVLMNDVRIGGSAYRLIQKDRDALESVALLKSDFSRITSEIQDFTPEADTTKRGEKIASIKNLTKDIDLNFKIVLESTDAPEIHTAINRANAIWAEYRKTLLDEVLRAADKGEMFKARRLINGDRRQQLGAFSQAAAQITTQFRQDISAVEQQIATGVKTKLTASAVAASVVIALIALFSYFVTTSITRPLKSCEDFAKAMAGGRLDGQLKVSGSGEVAELAHAMNIMAENLHSIVSRIGSTVEVLASIDNNLENVARKSANSAQMQEKSVQETSRAVVQISESGHEVYAGINKLSESATETAASSLEMAATIEEIAISAEKLEESVEEVSFSIIEIASSLKEIGSSIVNLLDASTITASSITKLDATIKQVEKNALESASISETVRSDAEIGKNAVLEAITGMQAIKASSQITSEVVETLSLRVNDIGTILSVIDEVAEQTNLLALNAAIIAAQAGEHGKGFAVVADEIRELAERTSSSTREITAVIKGVQEETRRAVDAINRAEESISAGEKLSQRSGTALEKIVAGVERTGIQVGEIAKATVEQARGSQSIREAMESIGDMVGNIANSSREHSRGTDMITVAVERMKELTIHVRTATREQSRAGNLIARSAEEVTSMVDHIREACRSQVSGTALISKSVNNIEGSTAANIHAAKVMNSAAAALTRQLDLLEKEMAGFKI